MDRKQFLKKLFLGAGAAVLAPRFLFGKNPNPETPVIPSGEYREAGSLAEAVPATPFVFDIENKSSSSGKCVLFGANFNLIKPFYGSDSNIEIVSKNGPNISYLAVLMQSTHQPFKTEKIRIESDNYYQVSETITFYSEDANAQSMTTPVFPQKYLSASAESYKIIDVPFVAKLDGSSQISFNVQPHTKLRVIVFPAPKTIAKNKLGGIAPVEFPFAPKTTNTQLTNLDF